MTVPDPTAFLEYEIQFLPNHARHHVVTRQEADELGGLLGVSFDERGRLELHVAVAHTATCIIEAAHAAASPWPELARAFDHCQGIASAVAMRGEADPFRRAAAGVLISMTSERIPKIEAADAEALVDALRAVEKHGAELAKTMMPRRGRPKATQAQPLHLLVKVAADIANDVGAKRALPSNERPEVGTPLTDFASALVGMTIRRAATVARHAFPPSKAYDVMRFANSSRPSPRVIVKLLREALKDR